jgi:serine protease Do
MKSSHIAFPTIKRILTFIGFLHCLCAKGVLPNEKLEKVYQSIVRIEVISERGSGGRMMKSRSTGSGVIVSPDGLVVTNHHVAGKATRLNCRLYNGEEIMADLLGADAMTDLAVLKLRSKGKKNGSQKLSVAKFGNSDNVKVGDLCYAMGSPAGLSQSITQGIISNLAMISPMKGSFRLDGENVGELVRWLGHDAVIFPGNSGGPLIDKNGFIIGINEVGIGSLGGAIPSNLAKEVSDELAQHGHVSRSWTGLECQPVIDPEVKGILVSGVIKNSPADKSKIAPGDIITSFAGKMVNARIPEDLPLFNQLAYGIVPGTTIDITGTREGKTMKWELKSEVRESAFAKEVELKSWGLTVRNFTLMSSLEARRKDTKGVQVHSVNRGGPSSSAKPNLLPGDIITKVGEEAIQSVNQLILESKKITRGKKDPVSTIVEFERNLAKLITVVKLGPEPKESQPLEAWKPWLGVSTQVLTRDLTSAMKLSVQTKGVRIAQVYPDTPAHRGGLLAGDLLFRIDGQIIAANRTEDSEVFRNMIKEYKTDSSIQVSGLRDRKPLDLNITLAKRPPPPNELPKLKDKTFEFTIREISFADRVNARLNKNQSGLIVENVEPAGWAALAGLRQGDLMLKMEGKTLKTVNEFQKLMKNLVKMKSEQIILFVKRGIHTIYIEVQPDWSNS